MAVNQDLIKYLEANASAIQSDPNLQKQLNQYARLTQQGQALGIANPQGTQQKGFLTGILPLLLRPQSAVLGGLQGLATGQSLENIGAALSGRETFTGSKLIGELPKGATPGQRFVHALTSLGIDIATDPFTYIGGRGGALRGSKATTAVEAQAAEAATKALKTVPEPVRVQKETPMIGTSTEIAKKEAENAINLLTKRPVSPAGTGLQQPSLLLTPTAKQEALIEKSNIDVPGSMRIPETQPQRSEQPTYVGRLLGEERFPGAGELSVVEPTPAVGVETPSPLVEKIMEAAGRGQMFEGGRGIKKAVNDLLIKEGYTTEQADNVTREIIKNISPELRGSIGFRVPGLGKSAKGTVVTGGEAKTRQLVSTPGAGYATDQIGLQNVAETTRNIFNQYRSSKFFAGWSKMMNGKLGEQYASVLNGKLDYADYRKLVKAEQKNALRDYNLDRAGSVVLSTAAHIVDQAANPEEARKYLSYYADMLDNMVLRPGAGADEIAGFEAASMLREHGTNTLLNEVNYAAQRAGASEVPLIQDYMARPLHKDELVLRAKRGAKVKEYDVAARRKLGTTVDEFGNTRQMTNKELNKLFEENGIRDVGHKVFSEDPIEIAAAQYASMKKLANSYHLLADLKELGSIQAGEYATKELLNPGNIVARANRIMNTFDKVAQKLTPELDKAIAAGDTAKIEKIETALRKIAESPKLINETLNGINDINLNPEGYEKIQTLFNALWQNFDDIARAGKGITEKQRANLFKKEGLFRTEEVSVNIDDLIAKGLVPLETTATVRLPRGLTNMYASEGVKAAIEKYYKVNTNKARNALGTFYDEVYKPYYTLFKTYVTVGRPGGYHWRNLQGGWWNNWLGDVSMADHSKSAEILIKQKKHKDTVTGAVNNVIMGKPSGLSGDADKLVQYVAGLAIGRNGIKAVDSEIDQLSEYLLIKDLQKIKIGNTDMATIYASAMDNGIYRNNRQLEYMRDVAQNEVVNVAEQMLNTKNVNLFSQKSRNELNVLERITNAAINNPYIRVSSEAANYSEKYLRMAAFISGARRFGLSDGGQAAGALTKALHFDYQDLSDFEREYLKNIIPFYTWARHNVPLQFSSLMLQPGKIDKLGFTQEELQTQFGATGDQPVMAQLVPAWMQDKLGFVSNLEYKGSPLVIAGGGFESPAYDLNRYLSFGLSTQTPTNILQQTVGSMNPLIKFGVETATGTSTFTRAPFSPAGAEVPFAFPGTFKGKEGEPRISSYAMQQAKNLLPPVGLAMNLTGFPGGERTLTNYLSVLGGAPISTLTPSQASAEIYTRSGKIRKEVKQAAYDLGVDPKWLSSMINEGYPIESIVAMAQQGYGSPTQ